MTKVSPWVYWWRLSTWSWIYDSFNPALCLSNSLFRRFLNLLHVETNLLSSKRNVSICNSVIDTRIIINIASMIFQQKDGSWILLVNIHWSRATQVDQYVLVLTNKSFQASILRIMTFCIPFPFKSWELWRVHKIFLL